MTTPAMSRSETSLRASRCFGAAAQVLLCALLAHIPIAGAVQPWYPVQVDVWQPPFNQTRQRVQRQYTALHKAENAWRICVSIPHLKDAYWLGVNHGLVEEARRLGVALSLYQAGGYEFLQVQRKQIEECLANEPHGLIVSAISLAGINDLVARADGMGIAVLDLINGMSSRHIKARVAPSYWINAHEIGVYLRRLQDELARPIKVAWFPGPDGAAWVRDADAGFRAAIDGAPIEILSTRFGDTGRKAQGDLIEAALAEHAGALDFLVGTAPSAEAAVAILRRRGLAKQIKVLAFYFSPGVYRGLRRGEIVAASSDSQGLSARIAVDLMVRILEKREYLQHVAPRVVTIDAGNVREWDPRMTLAPRGFRPIFSVNVK
jgi:protein TorT